METELLDNIGNGFSSVYAEYEKLSTDNIIDIARRKTIRNHVGKWLEPHHKILELNAGSGIDAVYFAEKGHLVLATDISAGAQHYIEDKIKSSGLTNLRFQKCSFTTLGIVDEKFDHIFSNFGGLNCTDDLAIIFKQFDDLLNPGGHVSLVIMPPYYPWEMATVIKGNKNAFRRLRKDGTSANVGNGIVRTFYHSPKKIKNAFPDNFTHIQTRNIGTFYPSAHFSSLQKYQKLISGLIKFDDLVNGSSLMPKGIGDYYIITFQKTH